MDTSNRKRPERIAQRTFDVRPADEGRKSKEGRQNVVVHEGAPADPNSDTNEDADEKVEIVEPDGSPTPRSSEEEEPKRSD